ncbi:palmitoyltransferase ZDHHC6-like [Sycon ciliatum]|uniref:palmitoyltransferase ZDHHC6-like n=1 Tax=Sycon ciliatum TaxID=27933 RepID=UPI0020AC81F3|eukprot:scpid54019/ scgid26422/ Probable palmitoyltransferase ZDHHC6; H4 homolog; Zinc finger DHHC domain-containing protein 6
MKLPKVIHWGPLVTIFLVGFIFYWSLVALSINWSWRTTSGAVHYILFLSNVFFLCINYFHAMQHGPGFVPLGWKPKNAKDEKMLQFCTACQGFKPPRAHHCRSCGRCVMKMDHHCPWINSCVGHENHATFTRFVLHAPLGCGYATYLQGAFLYRLLFASRVPREAVFFFQSMSSAFMLFLSIGFALGVTLSVTVLLFYQLRSIIRNRTMVEDWILDKAEYRHREEGLEPFVYPYDLGWKGNCLQVFLLSWYAKGDGITWTVRKGCDQYTLTKEQLEQKQRKRARSILYRCTKPYNGTYCPVRYGCCLCLGSPSLFDSRLAVREGDRVIVSRIQKRWLYGEILSSVDGRKTTHSENGSDAVTVRRKGWFPLQCAAPLEKDD